MSPCCSALPRFACWPAGARQILPTCGVHASPPHATNDCRHRLNGPALPAVPWHHHGRCTMERTALFTSCLTCASADVISPVAVAGFDPAQHGTGRSAKGARQRRAVPRRVSPAPAPWRLELAHHWQPCHDSCSAMATGQLSGAQSVIVDTAAVPAACPVGTIRNQRSHGSATPGAPVSSQIREGWLRAAKRVPSHSKQVCSLTSKATQLNEAQL